MLKPGLYEQVINKGLDRELSEATDKLCQTAPIDAGESSKVLAKYITEIHQLIRGISNIKKPAIKFYYLFVNSKRTASPAARHHTHL